MRQQDGNCKMEIGRWKLEDRIWILYDGYCKMDIGNWRMKIVIRKFEDGNLMME
jgi:hypothetical protein